MTAYQKAIHSLASHQYTWLITGVAGFIGSNLLEALLKLDQKVIGMDNLSTGNTENFDDVKKTLDSWSINGGDCSKLLNDELLKELIDNRYIFPESMMSKRIAAVKAKTTSGTDGREKRKIFMMHMLILEAIKVRYFKHKL